MTWNTTYDTQKFMTSLIFLICWCWTNMTVSVSSCLVKESKVLQISIGERIILLSQQQVSKRLLYVNIWLLNVNIWITKSCRVISYFKIVHTITFLQIQFIWGQFYITRVLREVFSSKICSAQTCISQCDKYKSFGHNDKQLFPKDFIYPKHNINNKPKINSPTDFWVFKHKLISTNHKRQRITYVCSNSEIFKSVTEFQSLPHFSSTEN